MNDEHIKEIVNKMNLDVSLKAWMKQYFVEKGKGEDTKAITGYYNVTDYGIKQTNTPATNSENLRALLNNASAGSVIYFPAGAYYFANGGFTIDKALTLKGEAHMVTNSASAGAKPESQLVLSSVGLEPNTTFFKRTTTSGVYIDGLAFYAQYPKTVGDKTETHPLFDISEYKGTWDGTLPRPVFEYTDFIEGINCFDSVILEDEAARVGSGGFFRAQNCEFFGFTGYALRVSHHRFIDNCGFNKCKTGIEVFGTDMWFNKCWFSMCDIAIHISDYVIENGSYCNLALSDTWCDMCSSHFIKCDTDRLMLLIYGAWVDMIDKAAIYMPKGYAQDSHIEGRFSRCGMMYAGIQDADRIRGNEYLMDTFAFYKIIRSDINVHVDRRIIKRGANQSGIAPSKLFGFNLDYGTSFIADSTVTAMDCTKDVVGYIAPNYKGCAHFNRTYIKCLDSDGYNDGNFFADANYTLERAGDPTGIFTPAKVGLYYRDTITGNVYRSTGTTSADWVLEYYAADKVVLKADVIAATDFADLQSRLQS